MHRERVLKVVLVLLGLLFSAAVYPLMMMVKQDPALAMMMSLYATLGVFLLLAARNPSRLHDLGDPIGAAAHFCQSLAKDGTWMIVELFAHDQLKDDLNPVGRV